MNNRVDLEQLENGLLQETKMVWIDRDRFSSLIAELKESRANLSEHKRLHKELNHILHPKEDYPKQPSLCDLVSYVRGDLSNLREKIANLEDVVKSQERHIHELKTQYVAQDPWVKDDEIEELKKRVDELEMEERQAVEYAKTLKSVIEKKDEALKAVLWWNRVTGGFCNREDERDVLNPVKEALALTKPTEAKTAGEDGSDTKKEEG